MKEQSQQPGVSADSVSRRRLLGVTLGAVVPAGLMAGPAAATTVGASGAGDAAPSLDAAIRAFTGGAPVRAGKVRVAIAPRVDTGNTVPLSVSVDHPMRPDDHVTAIAVFSERNPQHEVASFGLGPRNPVAKVSTRIRLATSQKMVAVARLSDGTYWSGEIDVIVTLAACIED
ncbi:MAG: SoxY-related AACIE arm protein [Betaproteobacteria bacterium]